MKHFLKLACIGFLSLIGCQSSVQQSPSKGSGFSISQEILRVHVSAEPTTLDPRKGRELLSLTLIRALFDGLMRYDKDLKPQMALADKITLSEDQKTYTFHLKQASWSNGQPIVAEDFLYAWKKVLEPSFVADQAFQLYVIKNAKACKLGKCSFEDVGVRALDSLTLQVELEHPTPYFLDLTTFPVFFPLPCGIDTSNPNWAIDSANYVNNGPFRLKHWKHHAELDLEKNETYWDKAAVNLQTVQLIIVNEETGLKMFEKNEVDWTGSPLSTLSLDALEDLKKGNLLHKKPILGTYFFWINTAKPPFDQLEMRQAFAQAINRQALVTHITQSTQVPASSLVPASLGLKTEALLKDGDVEAARELFKKVLVKNGWSSKKLPTITLSFPSGQRNMMIAQAVQEQWREAFDIEVQLEAVEPKVMSSRLSYRDYQLSIGSWIADFNDPINFLEVFKFKTASTNNTLWENADYVALLDQASLTVDPQERLALLNQSETLLMEAMPIIPIFHYTLLYLSKESVQDVILSSLGVMDFKWARMVDQNTQPIPDGKTVLEQGAIR